LLDSLNPFLLQQNSEGHTVVLVIDEAQSLEAPVLEQIRLISNLETDRDKLIQIVLSGQPELVHILTRKEMHQLNQRITVRYHLQPMDFDDTVAYVNHRLEVAGGRSKDLFSKRALRLIYRYSRGLPRLINAACDRTLLTGYARDAARINYRIAAAGIKDIRGDKVSSPRKRWLVLLPTFAALAAIFVTASYFTWHDFVNRLKATQSLEAIEVEPKKDLVITGEEFNRAMVAELGGMQESESARRAFNTLASLWNVRPVPESDNLNQFREMEHAAQDRELCLYRFSGNLGALLRIDYPAVLELNIPGIPGKRFISLVGMEDERLFLDPPIRGRSFLSFNELEKHWSGNGFLLWKDPLNLLTRMMPGAKGDPVKRLQVLLKEAGVYTKPLTGVYDSDTLLAVKEFQSSRGIEQDGIVGGQTLMLLYHSIDRFEVPRLMVGQK
jgi:general secretion pathway protein A